MDMVSARSSLPNAIVSRVFDMPYIKSTVRCCQYIVRVLHHSRFKYLLIFVVILGHHSRPNGNLNGSASPRRPSSDVSSSISPSQSASQNGHAALHASGPPAPVPISLSPVPDTSPAKTHQTQSYRLSIPPAHAISDQLLPPSVVQHRIIEEPEEEMGGSSADEDEQNQVLEVHENNPFGAGKNKGKEKEGVKGKKKVERRRKANTVIVDGSTDKGIVKPKARPGSVQFPTSSSAPPGFSLGASAWHRSGASDDNLHAHTTRERKKSSLLNSIAGLFRSSPNIPSYQESPSHWRTARWATRTDKNLKRVKGGDSSDDDARVGVAPDPVIDYDALKRKSQVEKKVLPEPGGLPGGGGGKRLRKASRKGGPGSRKVSSETDRIASDSLALAYPGEGRKVSGKRVSREIPAFPPSSPSALYNANTTTGVAQTPESNVTVVRSSSRAASLDGGRPILRKSSDKRRSVDVVSDSGLQVNDASTSTPPSARVTLVNGTPSPNGTLRVATRNGQQQQSLMSIVENVSAQNRTNWGKTNPNSLLVEVKAPQPVVNMNVERPHVYVTESPTAGKGKHGNANGADLTTNGSRIARSQSPTMATSQALDVNRLSIIAGSASTPSLPLRSGASDISSLHSGGASPLRPLRSALRTRTPSPNPVVRTVPIETDAIPATTGSPSVLDTQGQLRSPRIPGTTSADVIMFPDERKERLAKAKASTGTFGQPASPTGSSIRPEGGLSAADKGKWKERDVDRGSDVSAELSANNTPERRVPADVSLVNQSENLNPSQLSPTSDTNVATPRPGLAHAVDPERRWSVNSFASGDEDFQDALESIPPTPPPHEEVELAAAYMFSQTAERTNSSPAKSEHSQSTEVGPNHGNSRGAVVDTTENNVSEEKTPPPVRRKSVRVALEPTFAVSPPAIEDYEDEEDQGGQRDYWNVGPGVGTTVPRAPSTVMNGGPSAWTTRNDGNRASLVWEDSSEEEAEYSLAKQLLLRQVLGDKGKGRR